MAEISPEIISETQKSLGKYVTRPPLTEKLLRKPPFRFLHDVINTVVKETSFLKGLFSEAELQSDNVKDRDSKVAFLNKLITAVKTISEIDLQARSSKIIAGLEPEDTNKLLQAIGFCVEKKLDSKEYVNQLKGKTRSKSKDVAKISSVKSDKSNDSKVKTVRKDSLKKEGVKKETPKSDKRESVRSDKRETPKSERSKSKVKSESKESVKIKTKKDSPKGASSKQAKESSSKIKESSSKQSNDSSSKLLKEGKLIKDISAKLSKDVIAKQNKDISPKDASLKQTKDAKSSENQDNEVDGIKNVGEDEPTNEDGLFGNELEKERKTPLERPKSARPRSGDVRKEVLDVRKETTEAKKEEAVDVEKDLEVNKEFEVKKELEFKVSSKEIKPEEKKTLHEPPLRPKSSLRPPSVRPSSSRPGAPRLRVDSALPLREAVPLGKINVIVENFAANENKDDDEEETVVIQNITEEIPDAAFIEKSLDMPADKGHLVEQILEQIQGPEQLEEQVNLDYEGSKGRDATSKEINQLRTSIQSLTRTANPLGKLMSYLHEDVEAMHSELDSWTNMKRQFVTEIVKQKRINAESNVPLINQLQEIEDNIKKQREEIASVKFNILRNEEKIRDMMTKQVQAVQ